MCLRWQIIRHKIAEMSRSVEASHAWLEQVTAVRATLAGLNSFWIMLRADCLSDEQEGSRREAGPDHCAVQGAVHADHGPLRPRSLAGATLSPSLPCCGADLSLVLDDRRCWVARRAFAEAAARRSSVCTARCARNSRELVLGSCLIADLSNAGAHQRDRWWLRGDFARPGHQGCAVKVVIVG